MMDEKTMKYSEENLHSKPYRDLQKIAKEMKLPSNVKKVQMINLILTNVNGPIEKVKALIDEVRKDRARQAQLRRRTIKRKAQDISLTSSSRSQSPIITATPKRSPPIVVRCHPIRRATKRSQDGNAGDQFAYKPQPVLTIDQSEDRKPKLELVPNSKANGNQNGHLPEYQHMKTITNYNAKDFQNKMVLRNRAANRKYQGVLRTNLMPMSVKQTIQRVTHGSTSVKRVVMASSYGPTGSGIDKTTASQMVVKKTSNEIDTTSNKTYTYELIKGGVSIKNKDGVVSKVQAYVKKPCYMLANTESNKENSRQMFKSKSILNTNQTSTQTIDLYDINNQISTQNSITSSLLKTSQINHDIYNNNLECNNNRSINNQNIISQYNNNQNTISQNINDQISLPEANVNEFAINTSYMDTPMYMVSRGECRQNGELMTNEEITDYFHKKIRAESVRTRRATIEQRIARSEEDGRPSVSSDVTQPLYAHCTNDNTAYMQQREYNDISNQCMTNYVKTATEHNVGIRNSYSSTVSTTYCTNMEHHRSHLEPLYNLPNQYLYEPLQRCKTTSGTFCVYTSPLYTTSKLHISTEGHYVQGNLPPYMQQREYNDISNQCMTNYVKTATEHNVGIRNSYSSTDLEDSGCKANEAELPDMVADALEIISQDGDYMERMGMDVRMQCVLCSWAGAKIILEHHILKDHSNILRSVSSEEWRLECQMSLQSQIELLQTRHGAIYVVSVCMQEDYTLQVAFASIADYDIPTRGSITIYNKSTAQPYIWEGDIPNLPPSMIYEPQSTNCFVLPISRLDLMPANLKLIDGRLDPNSVGVDKNDIVVEIFFKIFT